MKPTLCLAVLLVCCGVATGQDHHDLRGGVLIAHYVPELGYSSDPPAEGWCGAFAPYAITDPADQNTRIDVPGDYAALSWYVLAAWTEEKDFCGVQFGLDAYDPALMSILEYAPCFPATGGLQIEGPSWPGPGQGIQLVVTGDSWSGNLVPVCWFGGYAYAAAAPGTVALTVDAVTGPEPFGGFVNCLNPPESAAATGFGVLGVDQDGLAVYPFEPPPRRACCVDEDCEILTLAQCDSILGLWLEETLSCSPNPCIWEAACCYGGPEPNCTLMTQTACNGLGGIWHSDWLSCDPNPCPVPEWACCYGPTGEDCILVTYDVCDSLGGALHVGVYECTPNPCLLPALVCCYGPTNELCTLVKSYECDAMGGIFHPEWNDCDPNPCLLPQRACCYGPGDEACILISHVGCDTLSGEFHPFWESCDPNPCVLPRYVCCYGQTGETCLVTTPSECSALDGIFHYGWESCDPNPCLLPYRVCCFGELTPDCIVTTVVECEAFDGEFFEEWETCDPNPCPISACCTGATCVMARLSDCDAIGGDWYLDHLCSLVDCEERRACCYGDSLDECMPFWEDECLEMGGEWAPYTTDCDPHPCPIVPGACCHGYDCTLVGPDECIHTGGIFHPGIETCDPNPCLPIGACCLPDETCLMVNVEQCEALMGTWFDDKQCDLVDCSLLAACCVDTVCILTWEEDCLLAAGIWYPEYESCDGVICPNMSDLSGGSFIVHVPPGLAFSTSPPEGGWCQHYFDGYAIQSSGEQINRIDTAAGSVWYVLAAWEEAKHWCGTEFGFAPYDVTLFSFLDYGPCYPPEGGLEIEFTGWPGPHTGTAFVATGLPWVGNYLPVYSFTGYAYQDHSGLLPISVNAGYENPEDYFGGFAGCESPGTSTEARCFGALGLFSDGLACHPGEAPLRLACCIDGECTVLPYHECVLLGGSWEVGIESCTPNPCARVCCVDDLCYLTTLTDCESMNGYYVPMWESCDPNPCGFSRTTEDLPTSFALWAIQPNPLTEQSRITFDLPREAQVQLRIFDASGRVVASLVEGRLPAGRHVRNWEGAPSGAGIYFLRMRAAEFEAIRTLVVLE